MKLKIRIAFFVSLLFSVLCGLISVIVYFNFSDFRREESKDRLEEKAQTTIKLLVEVKEVDNQLLKLIDQNTVNKLYNEKTLVFDSSLNLIYSSVDDAVIKWEKKDLLALRQSSPSFTSQGIYDVYGAFQKRENKDYYILVSAEDRFGNRKLEYLRYLLFLVSGIGIAIIWFLVFFIIRNLLKPLDAFQKNITGISENQLNIRLNETGKDDEIDLMAKAFNQMMKRIESGYDRQKEFTSSASHELRTPIARIIAQLENLKSNKGLSDETINYLNNINLDAGKLADKLNSLLLLSRMDAMDPSSSLKLVRVDELIFEAIEESKQLFPDLQPAFSIIDDDAEIAENMEIRAHESILKIAFINLIKNACLYSFDCKIKIEVDCNTAGYCIIRFYNNGLIPAESEREKIFQSFIRGNNALSQSGSGLGLPIVSSVVRFHKGEITYYIKDNYWNVFEVKLPF